MKKPLIFLLQLFVFISFNYSISFPKNKELTLEFSSEKEVYAEEEDIIINYKIINKSGEKVTFLDVCLLDCDLFSLFKLSDEKGVNYKYHGLIIDCIGLLMHLKPDDTLNFYNELLWGYGSEKSGLQKNRYKDYLKEGKYTLTFETRYCGNIVLESNVLKFEIKKPSQSDSYENLKEIFQLEDNSIKFDRLRKFIYDYPNSAYLDYAFRELVRLSDLNGVLNKNFFNDSYYFLSIRYNCWTINNYLKYISDAINNYKGEDSMIDFLAYVIKKYPGSKASEAAYIILRREIPNEFYIQNLLR